MVHLLTDLHRKCRWKWTVRFYDQSCTIAVLSIAMQHVVAIHRPPQIEVHHNLGLHYRIRWNTDSWNESKAKTTNFQNRTATRMFTVACFCLQQLPKFRTFAKFHLRIFWPVWAWGLMVNFTNIKIRANLKYQLQSQSANVLDIKDCL